MIFFFKNLFFLIFIRVIEPTHLTHQPVVGWARLENF